MNKIERQPWRVGYDQGAMDVYVEYQLMDDTDHNKYDVRLYLNGNWTLDDAMAYGEKIAEIMNLAAKQGK